jgi:hypothetical protein
MKGTPCCGSEKMHHLIGGKLNGISLQEVNGYIWWEFFFHQLKGGKGAFSVKTGNISEITFFVEYF